MPRVDAQLTAPPVTIEMQPADGTSPPIICSWAKSVWPGGDWTCTKDRNGITSGHDYPRFSYDVPNAGGSWTITFTGSSGTQTVTRSPDPGNIGDGAPIGCSCDDYGLLFTSDEMKGVGVVFGSATANSAGADAG
jgi:hypothetical protein